MLKKTKRAIRAEKANRGIRWGIKNRWERSKYGFSIEDTWDFNRYIAKVIADASSQMVWSADTDHNEIAEMHRLFDRYYSRRLVQDEEYKRMMKLFKKYLPDMWY